MNAAAPGDRLRIALETGASEATLKLDGELDLVTAPALREELARQRESGRRIVIDLSGVQFLDSTGLTLLMQSARDDETLRLSRDVSPAVARLLEVTKTERLFTWVDD